MKKILLFKLSLLIVVGLSAQTFQLMDHNDVDISGTAHNEYGSRHTLGLTKLHVKNLGGTNKAFGVRVTLEYVPYTLSDLAVCFGVACYSGYATVNTTQIINSGIGDNIPGAGTYTDLKVAPITWPWVNPAVDSCVWRVTIFDSTNPSDSISTVITWSVLIVGDLNGDGIIGSGEVTGDQNGNGIIDGSEVAGDVNGDGQIGDGETAGDIDASGLIDGGEMAGDTNGNGTIDGGEWLGDVNGNGQIDGGEIHGDADGNGQIDPGETDLTSINELNEKDVKLKAYPNPVSNSYVNISYSLKSNVDAELVMFNLVGKEIATYSIKGNEDNFKLDVSELNSGVYFYSLRVKGRALRTERLIIK